MNFLKEKLMASDLGILLTLGTAIGYAIYYSNESSFNQYYGLPSNYVSFSLPDLVLCITVVCIILFLIFLFYGTIFIMSEGLIPLVIKQKNVKYSFMFLGFVVGSANILYVLSHSTYLTQNQELILSISANISYIFMLWYIFKSFSLPLVLILACMFFVFIAKDAGYYRAVNKDSYLVMEKQKQDYVVINNYGDKFIIAPVDLKRRVISSKFQFIEMKSEKDNKIELSPMHTGKLKVGYTGVKF
ncbi:hypothetical protein CHN50_20945 [Priestia aryabhattai]|nr:hypothetical protein CHN50_20945 [Priestia aryabhattai]